MNSLPHLFANNRKWAAAQVAREPDFFTKLSTQQAPQHLWIGCADSRVPANEIVDLMPGELFVHRNVANVVVHTDLNCLAVLQYAVDVLKVQHVIVCGHFGCGGVQAALRGDRLGLIDNWLRHVQDVRDHHRAILDALPDDTARADALCALNVVEQVINVSQTTVVQDAWARGQHLELHGWVYRLQDGRLRDLQMTAVSAAELAAGHQRAVAAALQAARDT
ncbi:MAG: carbonate dehydratase [Candidatus Binatia bacterium]